nr:immunoglobulin light chain junction region [Macaca mulatta]
DYCCLIWHNDAWVF